MKVLMHSSKKYINPTIVRTTSNVRVLASNVWAGNNLENENGGLETITEELYLTKRHYDR